MNEVKEKEITEKVWFKRLSTIGIIIFSLGISMSALMVYLTLSERWHEEDDVVFFTVVLFIPSIISNLILFFIIRFIFYRLSPMGKKIALPLMWITGLPGFIVFILLFTFLFIAVIIKYD